MNVISSFEAKYKEYVNIFSNDIFFDNNNIYKELRTLSSLLYEGIQVDIQTWLNTEITSLFDDKKKLTFEFSKEFEPIYRQTIVRFDLIQDFLIEKKNTQYDIFRNLDKAVKHFVSQKEGYKIHKVVSILLPFSKKNEKTYSFMITFLKDYFSDEDNLDGTITQSICLYIKKKFSHAEQSNIMKTFPSWCKC
jgi:hypothetical protein